MHGVEAASWIVLAVVGVLALLGARPGSGAPTVLLVIVVIALLLDAGRLKRAA